LSCPTTESKECAINNFIGSCLYCYTFKARVEWRINQNRLNLRVLGKISSILLVYYVILYYYYYKTNNIAIPVFHFHLFSNIALTVSLIFAVFKYAPLRTDIKRSSSFPNFERGLILYFLIILFFFLLHFISIELSNFMLIRLSIKYIMSSQFWPSMKNRSILYLH